MRRGERWKEFFKEAGMEGKKSEKLETGRMEERTTCFSLQIQSTDLEFFFTLVEKWIDLYSVYSYSYV